MAWEHTVGSCHAPIALRAELYSFFNADQIIDFLLSIGMRPFVELSFMPTALASGSKTVFRYRSNVTPPKDYKQWSTLIKRLVAHWVERYGIQEVAAWFFEVWNEPNLTRCTGAWIGSGRKTVMRPFHMVVQANQVLARATR